MKKTRRRRDFLDIIGIIITDLLAAFTIAISLSPFLFWYLDYRSGGDCFSLGYGILGAIGLFFTAVIVDTIVEARKREKKEEEEEELKRQKLADRLMKLSEDFERDYAKPKKKARKRDIDKK